MGDMATNHGERRAGRAPRERRLSQGRPWGLEEGDLESPCVQSTSELGVSVCGNATGWAGDVWSRPSSSRRRQDGKEPRSVSLAILMSCTLGRSNDPSLCS